MAAIETTLKWNKVVGIYSLTSTGQYVPLTIGMGTFISVCWRLVQQEGVSLPAKGDTFYCVLIRPSFEDEIFGAESGLLKVPTASNLSPLSDTSADAMRCAFG